jgi:hypothetical protein
VGRIVARSLALVLVACGEAEPEPLEDAELAELCGEAAPVQLLTLSANEQPYPPMLADDRVIVSTMETMDPDDGFRGRLVSTSTCGGDVRLLLDRPADAIPRVSAAAPWLAQDDEELWWYDPAGAFEARFVARGQVVSEHDGAPILFVQSAVQDSGELARMVVEGDAFTLERILDGVTQATRLAQFDTYGVPPGTAFVRTEDAELLEVDLESGDTVLVAEGVTEFHVGEQGRFVAWYAERDYESTSLVRPWFILDRETGRWAEYRDNEANVGIGRGIAFTYCCEVEQSYLWMLPGLEQHVLHGTWFWLTSTESGRVVGHRSLPSGSEFWVFDSPAAEPRRLPFEGQVGSIHLEGDDLWVTVDRRLIRVPLDGSTPETVASPVSNAHWLPDGRVATVRHDTRELLLLGSSPPTRVAADVHYVIGHDNELFYVAGPDFEVGGHALYRVAIASLR